MTLLCVPIMVQDVDVALADAAQAKALGADLVEFRIDELFSGDLDGGDSDESNAGTGSAASASGGDSFETRQVLRLVSETPLPCIVTCRAAGEGGHYDGDDMARVSLYERLGTDDHPPRYIDVELATYTRSANLKQKVNLAVQHTLQVRDLSTSLILSVHDFAGRPPDLARRVASLRAQPAAAVHKVAFRARSVRDNLELFDLLSERDRPTIALGMGEFGLMSRVLAPKFGGFLTFASLRAESVTAPGQPTVDELLNLYRFRSITARTRVYAVVGWPVGHSLSPHAHNAAFDAFESPAGPDGRAGFDGVYLPLPVPVPEAAASSALPVPDARENGPDAAPDAGYINLKATLLELLDQPRLDLSGASVTVPHKENLLRLAREQRWEIDALSAACGAANTLVIDREPHAAGSRPARVRVANTDGPALADALASALPLALAHARVAVLGAGGAARAAAAELVQRGSTVVVYNRTRARADALVAEIRAALPHAPGRLVAAEWDALAKSCCHALVNCTPVGMAGGPAPAASPVAPDVLRACAAGADTPLVVMDTVYRPLETPLLRAARDAGLPTIDGVAMFVRQAERQSELWTGRPPPPGLMDRVVRTRLKADSVT